MPMIRVRYTDTDRYRRLRAAGHALHLRTRRLTWWLAARTLNRLPNSCWAELVAWGCCPWRLRQLWRAVRVGRECRRCSHCYCGKQFEGRWYG